jgi:N-acetylglutamate synthase-like GNAT family acetyltransferase
MLKFENQRWLRFLRDSLSFGRSCALLRQISRVRDTIFSHQTWISLQTYTLNKLFTAIALYLIADNNFVGWKMHELQIQIAKEDDQQNLRDILLENGQKPTILINDQSLYFFAEINHRKIGLIGAEISNKSALIRSLAVLKPWRNNGVSIKLISTLFAELKKRKIERLYLFSRDSGSFWEKIGFSQCDIHEIINNLPDASQVAGYIKDKSIWTDVAWHKEL